MGAVNDFALKQRKYMPVFPKATGKPTTYIEGYPYEDDEPMAATDFHAQQITTFSEQLSRYFAINPEIYIGVDNFIYYSEGDMRKCVSPDVYVVLGAGKYPLRRSFYTWAEGAVPTAIFEFLSDSTANQDRHEKVEIYLNTIGASEYFIHQPELKKPPEFRGWQRRGSAGIVELVADAEGGLFSESLNLYFRCEDDQKSGVRLLRPYLADGTAITTSMEEHQLRVEERRLRVEERRLRVEERRLRVAAEVRAETAEAVATAEALQRRELEAELARLRQQLANR